MRAPSDAGGSTVNRTHVVLADDHVVVREGLRHLVNGQSDFVVDADGGAGPEAVRHVRESGARVLVIDPGAGPGGVATIRQCRAECPLVHVMVLTAREEPELVRAAFAAGADGVLLKTVTAATFLAGLRAVAVGQRVLDPRLASVTDDAPPDPRADPRALSGREREILRHIALGRTHAEIAALLFLSDKTVETYRRRIKQKTGLKTRADFVRFGPGDGFDGAPPDGRERSHQEESRGATGAAVSPRET
jgi:two-component system response regulator NreC